MLRAGAVITEAEAKFAEVFGRQYSGMIETYRTEDADTILITLGSIAGLCRETADRLRAGGKKVGVVRLRYLRPFPEKLLADAVRHAKAVAVLEKDISFGYAGAVYTNTAAALHSQGLSLPVYNFVGGLGGKDISADEIAEIFTKTADGSAERVSWVGLEVQGA